MVFLTLLYLTIAQYSPLCSGKPSSEIIKNSFDLIAKFYTKNSANSHWFGYAGHLLG